MTTQELKQWVHEEFSERFSGLWLDGMHDYETDTSFNEKETKDKLKSFIDSIIDKTVQSERERIVGMIDKMERDCLCSPLQTEICDIERTFRRTQLKIINLITNKSDINKDKETKHICGEIKVVNCTKQDESRLCRDCGLSTN